MDSEALRRAIGSNIRDLRKGCDLTLIDLAKRLDVSYQQVQKYERGKNSISAEKMALIASIFGVPISRIYDLPAPHEDFPDFVKLFGHYRRIPTPELREIACKIVAVIAKP